MIRPLSKLLVLLLLSLAPATHAAWGDRDCTFGTSGSAAIPPPQLGSGPLSMTVDASGNLLVRNGDISLGSTLLKYTADGSALPDAGSSISPSVNDAIDVVQPDGTILFVTGYGYNPVGGPPGVGRFKASGGLDTTFGNSGYGTVSGANRIGAGPLVQTDGRILAGGTNGSAAILIRLNADGTADSTFGTAGLAAISGTGGVYSSIALQPDGKILALSFNLLVRHLANGQLDPGFGTGGIVSLPASTNGLQVRVQPSGHIVVALFSDTVSAAISVSRYDDTGVHLSTHPVTVSGLPTSYNALAWEANFTLTIAPLHLMADGRPVVIGRLRNAAGNSNIGAIVRLNADLTDDVSKVLDFLPRTHYVLSSGKIAVAGSGPRELRRLLGDSDAATCTATTTTLISSINPAIAGQAATLTATVAATGPTPTGTVQFRRDGANLGSPATLVNGVATASFNSQVAGDFGLSADYLPVAGYAGSTGLLVQTIGYGITINDPSANASVANPSMIFTVTLLGGGNSGTVTVDYATASNTAISGVDFAPTAGTLTFGPGIVSRTVSVPLTFQANAAPNKQFFLTLSNVTGSAGLARGAGIGTINYLPLGARSIYTGDASVVEGPAGTTLLAFTVSLSLASTQTVKVDYATANDTAIAGTDYVAQSGTLTFLRNQTQQWVVVPINGNATPQSNRSFFVNLTNATAGTTIARPQATGTIIDDDPTPAAATRPMYRLYSDVTKEHLYTTDANEYSVLPTVGWVAEGTAYTMFADAGSYGGQFAIPLYRLYLPQISQHHWTTDANEAKVLVDSGYWQYEGIPGYLLPAAGAGTTPLYRLMYTTPPLHLWTTDAYEKDVLSSQYGWAYEGVVGEVLP